MVESIVKNMVWETYELVSITCDLCGTKYTEDQVEEIQEFLNIRRQGGYGSVFGDEVDIECDICQACLKRIIEGKYREV